MDIDFTVPGDPIAKARPRAAVIGRRAQIYTPSRSKEYEYLVMLAAQRAMDTKPPMQGPVCLGLSFMLSVPPSWSKRKQAAALAGDVRPTGKPDLDNLLKATLDGMRRVVYVDDAQVCDVDMVKLYAETPGTVVRVSAIAARYARSIPAARVPLPIQAAMSLPTGASS